MNHGHQVSILFVCMGNICRSPTAQGVFLHKLREAGLQDRVLVDSAGTHAYHIGEAPDARAQQAARGRQIDLSDQRARKVLAEDFSRFDYVLAMDAENLAMLQSLCPPEHCGKARLFLGFASRLGERDVPDPYYGGHGGFEHVLDLVEAASEGLIAHLRANELR